MIKVTGMDALLKNLNGLAVDIPRAIDEAVVDVALNVKSDAVKSIQEVSAGNTVTRYSQNGKAYEHMASMAGDAPNTDTSRLTGSIGVQHKKGSNEAYVSTDLEYAENLEFGTLNMEARPFLGPAEEENRDHLVGAVTRSVQRQLRKATA